MGGIKNKLKQLSNKVANLVFSTRLGSSASGTASRRTHASRAFDDSGLRSLSGPVGLLSITKYASIACFTLALISTISLNLCRTYSSSNVRTNAVDDSTNSELATQANTDPAAISLSITPLTTPTSSPCDTSNSDICLSIPDEGGIATGGHTIKINTNSIAGWNMSLSTNNDGNLVNNENEANVISSLPNTVGIDQATTLSNNTWGIALPYGTNAQHYSPEANYLTSDKDTLASTLYSSVAYFSQSPDYLIAQRSDSTIPATETRNIYYGVRVDNPSQLLAGDYQAQVVYTATVKLPSKPTITSLDPSMVAHNASNTPIAIYGTNLLSTYNVYVDMGNGSTEQCTNLTVLSDSKLTCTLPTFTSTGDYVLVLETQGGEDSGAIRVVARPVINSIDPPTIETNNNQAVVTLIGEDLANVSQVFVDFNSNERADSGETCQIQSILIGQYISCLAPEYGSVGEFNVYAVSDGILSNSVELGYIEPEPTISVTSVLPEHVDRERYLGQVNFSISGENLADVARVVLYGTSTSYTGELECTIVSVGANRINCNVNAWQYLGHTYDQYVSVTFYDSGGNVLLQMGRFCSFD